jgi:hypothetical protein
MANPTSVAGIPAVITVDAAGGYFAVDVDREYTLKHDGENSAGTASTHIIYISINTPAPPDGVEGADKAKLCAGDVIVIGPGISQIRYDCAATEEATMTVIPSVRLDLEGQSSQAGGIRATTSGAEEITAELGDVNVSLGLLDNTVGTHDSDIATMHLNVGTKAETTVPAAVADGDDVQLNADEYGRLRSAEFDPATGTAQVTDTAPAQMAVLIEDGWAALTAAGDLTSQRDVRDYENHTIAYDITIGTLTDMDLIIWGSIDGTLWFPMSSFNVLAAGPLEDAVTFSGVQVTYIRCELEAENGAADGSVVFQLTSGN